MKHLATSSLLILLWATHAAADLTNPCTLTLKETSSSHFSVQWTLPIIQGRVLKARPVLPDVCVLEGPADVQGDGNKVVSTWAMRCAPSDLIGQTIGIQGLLGTFLEVLLTVETLDGRKYLATLRPVHPSYVVPPSPTIRQLILLRGGASLRQTLQRPELALWVLLFCFSGVGLRQCFTLAIAFSIALAFGQWLKSNLWLEVPASLPTTLVAALSVATSLKILRGGNSSLGIPHTPSTLLLALMGILYGDRGLPIDSVLTRQEQFFALLCSAGGAMTALGLLMLTSAELRAAIHRPGQSIEGRLPRGIVFGAGMIACALAFYHATALPLPAGWRDTVPLLAFAALGAWSGGQPSKVRWSLPILAGGGMMLGMSLGLRGISLPETTMVVYGSMVLIGALMMGRYRWPVAAAPLLVAGFSMYHSSHAASVLRESVPLPMAHGATLGVLLAFVFLVLFGDRETRFGGLAIRSFGLMIILLALGGRMAEYWRWGVEEIAVDSAMGMVRIPLLSMTLMLIAWVVWPRRRRFQPKSISADVPLHWGLVLLALFTLSVGSVRVKDPFHTPRPLTEQETCPILAKLLTQTYLAFNLADEDAAFDQLAQNVAVDLVPGVYLDSRRRLTAGTRQGAEVTVKDVDVISVEGPAESESTDGTYTTPCQWVVTARVKHWQHIHDRQNAYLGRVGIRLENDRWKISRLDLLSEEREILARRTP